MLLDDPPDVGTGRSVLSQAAGAHQRHNLPSTPPTWPIETVVALTPKAIRSERTPTSPTRSTDMAQYQAGPPAAPADYPGQTLGIVGLVLAIVAPLIGLIVSIIARKQSREAGFENQLAKIGVIVGAILTVLGVIGTIIYIVLFASLMSNGGELPDY